MSWDAEFFSPEEFVCTHCGIERMDHTFIKSLDSLRMVLNAPLLITSGYRCLEHPIEAAKGPNSLHRHSTGRAADITCAHHRFRTLLGHCTLAFDGIGIKAHGERRFIHVDLVRHGLWSYK